MTQTAYLLATIDMPAIDNIRTLSNNEFKIATTEIDELEKFHNEDALFNLVELNYIDIETRLDFYLNQYIENPGLDFSEFSSQFLDLNRLILNLLSSIRTYLDHTETRLKRTFKDKSSEVELFKRLTSEAFDGHFAYRFLEKLRNYSQHCGLPTGEVTIIDDEKGHSIKLSLLRDSLLTNFDSWGAIIKPELEVQEDKFDIIPLLEKKVELLKEINQKISLSLLQKLTKQGNHLLELIIETQDKGKGIPSILYISGPENSPKIEIKWFPYDVISKITGVELKAVYTGEKNYR